MSPIRTNRIRPAAAPDAQALIALHHRAVHAVVHPAYPQALLDAWSPAPGPERHRWMRERIADPALVIRVAESDGAIVGFAIAVAAEGWIRALYVDPDCSRRGVGAALLHALEERLRATSIRVATLNASFNAERFYREQGYRIVAPTAQQLGDGSWMECLRMDKPLP